MIKRIVKMEFRESEIDNFITLFDTVKDKIRSFEGCNYLELWQDIHNKSVFMTYSYWDSIAHLNAYRQSELFNRVWAQTKVKFSERPIAWSVSSVYKL